MSNLYDPRIEDEATEVLGIVTPNSIAHRLAGMQNYINAPRYWYGRNLTTGFIERSNLAKFTIVAGTLEDWGTALQISNGTEIEGGNPNKFLYIDDFFISTTSLNDRDYEIEFWYGTTIFASSTFLTSATHRISHQDMECTHINIHSPVISCNNKLWCRCKCENDGATLSFRIGLHIYEG